ncbi:hypothetical protein ABH923_000725 [Leifsonia sp. EB41]
MQQQVAGEDGRRLAPEPGAGKPGSPEEGVGAELAGDVRTTATNRVAVDHVVVQQEGGVQELERERGLDGGGAILRLAAAEAGQAVERRQHQPGPEPLAAAGGLPHGLPQAGVLLAVGRGVALAGVEESGQLALDGLQVLVDGVGGRDLRDTGLLREFRAKLGHFDPPLPSLVSK